MNGHGIAMYFIFKNNCCIMGNYSTSVVQLPAVKLQNSPDGEGALGNELAGKMYYKGQEKKDLVVVLQQMLKELGNDLGKTGLKKDGVDSIFGKKTEDAVKKFQESRRDWEGNPLKVDGLVGPKTSDALNRTFVDRWYEYYQTPVELTKEYTLLTATAEGLQAPVNVKIDDETKARIVITTLVPKRKEPPTIKPPDDKIPPDDKKTPDKDVYQDMWANRDDNDSDCHRSGYKTKYAEKDGNYVKWLLDGAEAMFDMCDAICQATFVWVNDAYFSPGIGIARGRDYDTIKARYPDIIGKVDQLNAAKGLTVGWVPLISLLTVRAEEIKVRIIIFHPDSFQDMGGGPFAFQEARDLVRSWSGKIDCIGAMWGGTYEGHEVGGHHEKSLVVGIDDQIISYCGGVDFAYARWARPTHKLMDPDAPMDVGTVQDPVKIEPQMGLIDPSTILGEWNDNDKEYSDEGSPLFWHDVHIKVAGPAAVDLADNFIDRYIHARSPANEDKADVDDEPDFKWVRQNYARLSAAEGRQPLLKSEEVYSSGKIFAQTLRSYYTMDDYGIWDAYRNLLCNANYCVYIENQYAFEDTVCMAMFREIITAKKNLKVIIVAPFMPDSYESDIRKNLTSLIEASMDGTGDYSKARVTVYSLLTTMQRDNAQKNVPIYVHAKLAVVDDEWAIVGSANLDRMGMGGKGGGWGSRGSSELALLIHGKEQALAIRNRLVREHLGSKAPGSPDDFDAVFKAFIGTAAANGKPRENKPLTGQVCFHKLYNDM